MSLGLSNAEIGAMYFRVEADMKQIQTSLSSLQSQLQGTAGVAQSAGTGISAAFNKIGISMKALTSATIIGAVITGLYSIGKAAVKASADMEQNITAFEVMLGSSKKAKEMLTDIQQFAAKTPYQMTGLTEAAKLMMNFGVESDKVMQNLQMLGDVAGGNEQKLHSLTLAFSQMSAAGRLMGQDLLQMVNAGFNPLQEISRKTGESMASLKKKMEDGKISTDMVRDAFKSATGEGGRFYGMMDKQSRTLSGLWSTMKDNISIALISIGDKMAPALKNAMGAISQFMGSGGALVKLFSLIAQTISIVVNGLAMFMYSLSAVASKAKKEIAELEEANIISAIKMQSKQKELITNYESALKFGDKSALLIYGESLKKAHDEIIGTDKDLDASLQGLKQSWSDLTGIEKKANDLKAETVEQTKKQAQATDQLSTAQKKQLSELAKLKAQSIGEWVASIGQAFSNELPKMSSGFSALSKAVTDLVGLEDKMASLGLTSGIQKAAIEMKAYADTVVGVANTVIGALQDIANYNSKIMQDQFQQDVEMQNAALAFMHDQQLAYYGLQEETAAQKAQQDITQLEKELAKTRDTKKRAQLKEQIDKKKDELKKANIDEEFDKRKAQLQAIQELRERQMKQREAARTKGLALMSAIVNMAGAIMGAWASAFSSGVPWPAALAMGLVSTALIGAIGGLQIAMISGAPIPFFADGGLVTGPTLGMIGEGKDPEGVFPLNENVFALFAAGIVNQMDKMNRERPEGITAGEDTIILHNVSTLDGRVIEERTDTIRRKRGQRLGAGNYAYGSAY